MVGRSGLLQRNFSAQLVGIESGEQERECDQSLVRKREDKTVLACGRGRCLVWVDGGKECRVDLVCVAMKGSMRVRGTHKPSCNWNSSYTVRMLVTSALAGLGSGSLSHSSSLVSTQQLTASGHLLACFCFVKRIRGTGDAHCYSDKCYLQCFYQ